MSIKKNESIVTIGIPVYNGEKTLAKTIDSLLKQTLLEFEIIISDNASTDSTDEICNEYMKKDKRIKYFRQKNNLGEIPNYKFVLEKAITKYFLWFSADDLIIETFLEDNINFLEKNEEYMGSTGRAKYFGKLVDNLKINDKNSIEKKLKRALFTTEIHTVKADVYSKRIKKLFKCSAFDFFVYCIFRTEKLKKCTQNKTMLGESTIILVNALKFGNFNVFDKVMIQKFVGDTISSGGMIDMINKSNVGKTSWISPYYNLTLWCFKNLGMQIFLQNFSFFIKMNIIGEMYLIYDILRKIRKKIKS